jgi:hypothetical protein
MENAKLRLSEEELRLVTDPSFILTKNAIIQKVYLLFGMLADDFREMSSLPEEVGRISPKIAKGENYLGLPYVMLDYPRFFSAEHIMAIRCFFWWGNFFSITLHLKGKFREQFSTTICEHYEQLSDDDYSIAISDEEWHHHFGKDHYQNISSMSNGEFRLYVEQHPYIKIAKTFPLVSWENMQVQLNSAYSELIRLITTETVK